MILITRYKLVKDKKDEHKIRVKSEEESICPICFSDTLKVIGSRNRKAIEINGDWIILIIRRLKCLICMKIHHELPDILVPYKRYLSECIEAIIDGTDDEVACENSTIIRFRQWFKSMENHIKGSIMAVYLQMINVRKDVAGKTALEAIKAYVGADHGWLARAVRIVVNSNNWVHTRYAFFVRS
ncbi:MAG: hypothetical protein GX800_00470 [Clostridiaceae bacterium]|nr:hypothetical protein [Clostridiaceae bacterium]